MNQVRTQDCILLVDDDKAIIDNLAPLLERSGFAVAVATNGETALDRVTQFAPDLIVLDVLMPKLNGREVLRHLRRTGDWTPVILLTRVAELRRALDDDPEHPRFIDTVVGQGYRFVAPVEAV